MQRALLRMHDIRCQDKALVTYLQQYKTVNIKHYADASAKCCLDCAQAALSVLGLTLDRGRLGVLMLSCHD